GLDGVGNEPTAFAFADLPLAEGVRRILRERNFTVVLAHAGAGERLVRITLTALPASGVYTAPLMEPLDESLDDDEDTPAVVDPIRQRTEAIGLLAQQGEDADVKPELEHTLAGDPEATVRRAALHGLLARGLLVPDVALHVAREDPDPGIRGEV